MKHTVPDAENRWRIIYISLCLVLLALTAVQFIIVMPLPSTGWDYRAYASGVIALEHGQDPYVLQNIVPYQSFGTELNFNYPPHTLYLFRLLDIIQVFHVMALYILLLLAALGASLYLILRLDDRPGYLFGLTLVVTGFMATFWNFLTLNSSIFFLLLFAIVFTLWKQEQYLYSAVVMGFCASLTLFTTPFIALFLALKRPLPERLSLMGVSAGVMAGMFLLGYLVNPPYLFSFIAMLTGQKSPFLESGGWNQPTPYLLFRDIGQGIVPGSLVPGILISCLYIGCVAYGAWYFRQRNRNDTLAIVCMLMIAIFMLLPRQMPYNFIILVIPLYLLFKDRGYLSRLLVVAVLSLPIAIWLAPVLGIGDESIPFALAEYAQMYSLLLVFAVILLHDLLPGAEREQEEGKKPGKTKRSGMPGKHRA